MKRCPECGREYYNTMMFCLDDGAELLYGLASIDEPATAIFEPSAATGGSYTMEEQSVSANRMVIHAAPRPRTSS